MKSMEREMEHLDTMGLCLNIQINEVNDQIKKVVENMEKYKDAASYITEA
jgi:hypothetical protein